MVIPFVWRFPQLCLLLLTAMNLAIYVQYPALPVAIVLALLGAQIFIIAFSLKLVMERRSPAWPWIFVIALHLGVFGSYLERLLDVFFKPLH